MLEEKRADAAQLSIESVVSEAKPRKCKEPTGVTVSIVFIDKSAATELLGRSGNRNRNIRRKQVEKHIRTMLNGDFGLSPDAIAIAKPVGKKPGRVLNAFHRLSAIAESGMGQWFVVLENCDPSMMKFTDEGAKRTNADREKIIHPERSHHSDRQATLRTLFELEVNQYETPSYIELEGLYKLNKDNVDAVVLSKKGNGVTCGVLAGIAYALGTEYSEQASEFMDQLFTGVGIRNRNAPARTLSTFLDMRFGSRKSGSRSDVITSFEMARLTLYAIYQHIKIGNKKNAGQIVLSYRNKDNRERYGKAHEFFAAARTAKHPRPKK